MTLKISASPDCGNSPKRIFLRDLTIAFAQVDIAYISASVSDDVTWEIVGGRRMKGKDDFLTALERLQDNPASELNIQKVITHGREGAVCGDQIMADGKRFAFCDVYVFVGAKGKRVKAIQSFVIDILTENS